MRSFIAVAASAVAVLASAGTADAMFQSPWQTFPGSHDSQVHAHIKAVHKHIAKVARTNPSLDHRGLVPRFQTQAVSQACQTLIDQIETDTENAYCDFPDVEQESANAIEDKLNLACADTSCFKQILAKKSDLESTCTTDEDKAAVRDLMGGNSPAQATQIVDALCAVSPSNSSRYCITVTKDFDLDLDFETQTEAQIEADIKSTCEDDCVPKILELFATPFTTIANTTTESSGDTAEAELLDAFDLICLKKNDEYCIPKFKALTELGEDTVPTGELICSPCARALFTKTAQFVPSDDSDSIDTILKICQRNQGGTFCVDLFQSAQSQIEGSLQDNCRDDFENNNACSAACQSATADFVSSNQCCAKVLLDIALDGEYANGTVASFLSSCGTPLRDCKENNGKAKANTRVKNLKFSYYQANKATLDDKLAKDIARGYGLEKNEITITEVTEAVASTPARRRLLQTATGVDIKYEIQPTSVSANEAKASLKADSAISFTSLTSLPADAKIDADAGFEEETTARSFEVTEQPSAAAMHAPAFWTVLVASVALLFTLTM